MTCLTVSLRLANPTLSSMRRWGCWLHLEGLAVALSFAKGNAMVTRQGFAGIWIYGVPVPFPFLLCISQLLLSEWSQEFWTENRIGTKGHKNEPVKQKREWVCGQTRSKTGKNLGNSNTVNSDYCCCYCCNDDMELV